MGPGLRAEWTDRRQFFHEGAATCAVVAVGEAIAQRSAPKSSEFRGRGGRPGEAPVARRSASMSSRSALVQNDSPKMSRGRRSSPGVDRVEFTVTERERRSADPLVAVAMPYRSGESQSCPVGRNHWYVGRLLAECGLRHGFACRHRHDGRRPVPPSSYDEAPDIRKPTAPVSLYRGQTGRARAPAKQGRRPAKRTEGIKSDESQVQGIPPNGSSVLPC